jgi:hypothetical protein
VLEGGGRIDQASIFGDSLPDAPGPLIIVAVRGIQQTVTVIPRLDLFAGVAGGRGERWFRWSGVDRAREDRLGALIPPDRSRTRGLLGEGAAAGWGTLLDAAPHLGLAGPLLEAPSQVRSYAPGGQ